MCRKQVFIEGHLIRVAVVARTAVNSPAVKVLRMWIAFPAKRGFSWTQIWCSPLSSLACLYVHQLITYISGVNDRNSLLPQKGTRCVIRRGRKGEEAGVW